MINNLNSKNQFNENKQSLEFLNGLVERITYHNEENGFCVLRIKVKGRRDLITLIGNAPSVCVGEEVHAQGKWFNSSNYGLEFKADFIRSIPPTTLEGIEKYLGSGLIRGIGTHYAKKLVQKFKEEVFSIIEEHPHKLMTIEGIGKVRADSIARNWVEQKVVREIMLFLQSHGVGTSRATRIYKTYGDEAIKVVSENPYNLARDITGIGFLTADKIAKSLGIEEKSEIRARAGINHILAEALSEGHCGLPVEILFKKAREILSIEDAILNQALIGELKEEYLIKDRIGEGEIIFLAGYYSYEKNIAIRLKKLKEGIIKWHNIEKEKVIEWVQNEISIELAETQKEAIHTILSSKTAVITGGPGTGKTTLLNSVLKIFQANKYKVILCAPTGRAAKRLNEATGIEASTIHRLLQYDPSKHEFKFDQDNPLECDVLVVDETSMVDVQIFYSILKALPDHAGLIIVGDVDQLPSVGPGQVLKDIIDSGAIPTVKLTEIFRQGKNSNIITSAHAVNEGMFPRLEHDPNDKSNDFYFIEANTPEKIIDIIIRLVRDNIPGRFKFDPTTDIQVLSPMQRGGCGARSLNIELQKALNPNSDYIEKYGQKYAIGDKVMQMENNYDKEVYNGDIGFIEDIYHEEKELRINFDGKQITYFFDELDELSIAYATTIHKSQGSEYPAVVIPLSTQHFPMLQKNLLYTAITRGSKLVVLVGEKKAIAIAVKNKKETKRYTKLREWLAS